MKHYHTFLNSTCALALGALMTAGLSGCAADELVDESGTAPSELGDVTVIATFGQGVGTRTGHEDVADEGIKVSWAAGDAIKIVCKESMDTFSFTTFSFAKLADDGISGIFKGKAEPGKSFMFMKYTVLYPASVAYDENGLSFDMTGQTQWGNGNMAHLGAYDVMMANVNSWKSCSFEEDEYGNTCHLNALMTFDLKGVPADLGRPQSITLGCTSTNPVFSSNVHTADGKYLVPTLELKLTGFTTPTAGTTFDIKAYLMMASCTIPAGKKLTITVKGDKNSYTFTSAAMAEAKSYQPNRRYTASVDASGWTKVIPD